MLKETGFDTVIIMADLDITGLSTAVCDANHVKKARYVLEVLAVCLSILQQAAYKASLNEDKELTFKDWIAHETGVMFRYWNFVLTCIKTHLMFVRSFREADFYMLLSSLEHIMPCSFLWTNFIMPGGVQCLYNLQDLYELKNRNPSFFDEFKAGSFAVNTPGVAFSRIAYNHASGSTAGSTDVVYNDDNRFSKSLELALLEIQEFLSAVEGDAPTIKHKENMQSSKDTYSPSHFWQVMKIKQL